MTTKRKIGDVLWLALVCAKQDRLSLIDAYGGNRKEEAVQRALEDIKAFNALQLKLFGTTQTKLEAAIAKMRPVDIIAMIARGEHIEISEESDPNDR